MPRYIVKLDDYYFEYSTVVDAPVTYGMKLEDFKKYYREEYGQSGMNDLEKRLERVEKTGTSSMQIQLPEELMRFNRAGPNENRLKLSEIFKAYCLREQIRKGWIP